MNLQGLVLDGKYRVEEMIGEGGAGVVWRAEHVGVRRKVAVKFLWPEYAHNPDQVARFHREAQAAGYIGHDNICEVIDIGSTPHGAPYLVMPLLKGRTLARVISDRGALAVERAVDILRQTLSGLGAAHAAGIVHRDLKPENLFITRVGDRADFVKILDFGISKVLEHAPLGDLRLTRIGTVVGTPCYMAPEQARGEHEIDQRVDLWAAGVILYEMLTGRLPFSGSSYNEIMFHIVEGPIVPPRELRPDLPPEIDKVVLRAMERDRARRFDSAQSFRLALTVAWQATSDRDRPSRVGLDTETGSTERVFPEQIEQIAAALDDLGLPVPGPPPQPAAVGPSEGIDRLHDPCAPTLLGMPPSVGTRQGVGRLHDARGEPPAPLASPHASDRPHDARGEFAPPASLLPVALASPEVQVPAAPPRVRAAGPAVHPLATSLNATWLPSITPTAPAQRRWVVPAAVLGALLVAAGVTIALVGRSGGREGSAAGAADEAGRAAAAAPPAAVEPRVAVADTWTADASRDPDEKRGLPNLAEADRGPAAPVPAPVGQAATPGTYAAAAKPEPPAPDGGAAVGVALADAESVSAADAVDAAERIRAAGSRAGSGAGTRLPDMPSRSAVVRRFASIRGAVRSCTGGALAGPVTVRAVLRGPDGSVQDVSVTGWLMPAAVACVRNAVAGLSFPRFGNPTLTVTYTYGADAAPQSDAGGPEGPHGTKIVTTYGESR